MVLSVLRSWSCRDLIWVCTSWLYNKITAEMILFWFKRGCRVSCFHILASYQYMFFYVFACQLIMSQNPFAKARSVKVHKKFLLETPGSWEMINIQSEKTLLCLLGSCTTDWLPIYFIDYLPDCWPVTCLTNFLTRRQPTDQPARLSCHQLAAHVTLTGWKCGGCCSGWGRERGW